MAKEKAPERRVQKIILEYLRGLPESWWIKAISIRKGVPDIIGCYKGRFVAFEVKAEDGKVTEIQEEQIKRIRAANGYAFIVTSLGGTKTAIQCIQQIDEQLHRVYKERLRKFIATWNGKNR